MLAEDGGSGPDLRRGLRQFVGDAQQPQGADRALHRYNRVVVKHLGIGEGLWKAIYRGGPTGLLSP